jgi:hypothetical protein
LEARIILLKRPAVLHEIGVHCTIHMHSTEDGFADSKGLGTPKSRKREGKSGITSRIVDAAAPKHFNVLQKSGHPGY